MKRKNHSVYWEEADGVWIIGTRYHRSSTTPLVQMSVEDQSCPDIPTTYSGALETETGTTRCRYAEHPVETGQFQASKGRFEHCD